VVERLIALNILHLARFAEEIGKNWRQMLRSMNYFMSPKGWGGGRAAPHTH